MADDKSRALIMNQMFGSANEEETIIEQGPSGKKFAATKTLKSEIIKVLKENGVDPADPKVSMSLGMFFENISR